MNFKFYPQSKCRRYLTQILIFLTNLFNTNKNLLNLCKIKTQTGANFNIWPIILKPIYKILLKSRFW